MIIYANFRFGQIVYLQLFSAICQNLVDFEIIIQTDHHET